MYEFQKLFKASLFSLIAIMLLDSVVVYASQKPKKAKASAKSSSAKAKSKAKRSVQSDSSDSDDALLAAYVTSPEAKHAQDIYSQRQAQAKVQANLAQQKADREAQETARQIEEQQAADLQTCCCSWSFWIK